MNASIRFLAVALVQTADATPDAFLRSSRFSGTYLLLKSFGPALTPERLGVRHPEVPLRKSSGIALH